MTSATRHALGTTLLATALAAACSSPVTNRPRGASSPPSGGAARQLVPGAPGPSPAASPGSSVASCASAGLKVHVDTAQGGAAAGSTYVPIDFTNTTSSTCTLFGYPGVSFVTSPSGSQLGRPATRNPADPATMVTLAPGGVAHATLQVAEAGNYSPSACKPVTAHWLRIYPPNQFNAIYTNYTVQACSARLPPSSAASSDIRRAARRGQGRPGTVGSPRGADRPAR